MQFSPTNDLENWLIYSKRNIKTDKLGIVQKGYFGKETKFVKIWGGGIKLVLFTKMSRQ